MTQLSGADGARKREVAASRQINETFAQYVQSTSFSLSLGRTHVRALEHIARGDTAWIWGSRTVAPNAMRGLEHRGLVTHRPHVGEPPPFSTDAVIWELTTAGKLVVLLLTEAGLLEPGLLSTFPPPPPGWTDPRPKLKPNLTPDGRVDFKDPGWHTEPSDREHAERVPIGILIDELADMDD